MEHDSQQIAPNEILRDNCRCDYLLLISFKGALSVDLLDTYLKNQTSFSHVLMFNDTQSLTHADKFTKVDMESYTWVATKLFKPQFAISSSLAQPSSRRFEVICAIALV